MDGKALLAFASASSKDRPSAMLAAAALPAVVACLRGAPAK